MDHVCSVSSHVFTGPCIHGPRGTTGSRVNARVHGMYTRAVHTMGLYRVYMKGRK